jgi:DNA-binding MarR family transcriptional regulator
MTPKHLLILFLISCKPGIRSIYTLIRVFDRADFPSELSEPLKILLNNNYIQITQNFDNGTPKEYGITEDGKIFLDKYFNEDEAIDYIKKMQTPEFLLTLTQAYIDKGNER